MATISETSTPELRRTPSRRPLKPKSGPSSASSSPILQLLLSLPHPTSTPLLIAFVLILAFFLKSLVSLGSFSGKDTPPRFGDFEAQRFWMEVTLNNGIKQWYTTGEEWWQLDCEWVFIAREARLNNVGCRPPSDSVYQLDMWEDVSFSVQTIHHTT